MAKPQVYFKLPTFTLWPDSLPLALPPPIKERSFRSPFGIDKDLFNFALRPEIPLTFASLYIVAVFGLNAYNRRRDNKPWWIARQACFNYFVIIHNGLLTLYSAATFAAMCRAIAHTWPGLNAETGLAGVADALCKIHGPRGLGDAASFNTTISIWEVKNTVIKLGYDGNPDPTDYGRLWNEGLAFWGWMFYVSKFYEVLDTFIILAKGKRSASLQTYHHSGAMLCMWAGIRFMSPPIWMFVFVNSFIHALMYTYFTLSALGYRVPNKLKRALTSLQIAQFVWGASYAAAHLFIQYDIPVVTPYRVAATISSAFASATSAAAAATSTIQQVVETPSAFDWVALGKKLILRGLGEEGIAERVTNKQGLPIVPQMQERIEQFKERTEPIFETKWRTNLTKVDCIDTSGEAFAIILNLFYLAPLTWLFARFFIRAYTGFGKPRTVSQSARQAIESGKIAEKKTEEKFEQTGARLEKELEKADTRDLSEQLKRDVRALKEGTLGRDRRVSDHVQDLEKKVKDVTDKAKQQAKKFGNGSGTGSPRRQSPSKKGSTLTQEESSSSQKEFAKVTPQRSREALAQPSEGSQSELKQEINLADSQAIRTGTDVEDVLSESTEQGLRPSARDGLPADWQSSREGSDNEQAKQSKQGDTYASVASLNDPDAMGKSGTIIDLVSEKVENAKEEAEEASESVFGFKETSQSSSHSSRQESSGSNDRPAFIPPGVPANTGTGADTADDNATFGE